MSNVVICYPNYADGTTGLTPTYSGGSWLASLPLTNLIDQRLAKVARSTDTALASTKLVTDLGAPRGIKAWVIPKHNFSLSALVRLRGSNTSGDYSAPQYDSGWVAVFPVVYASSDLEWGDPAFWTGTVSTEDRLDYNIPYINVMSSYAYARYWQLEVSDISNADGYVEMSRLILSGAFIPRINASYGMGYGWENTTGVQQSLGGVELYDEQPTRRKVMLELSHLSTDEAFYKVFDMVRKVGISRQLFFVFDTADTKHMHRRSFLGTLRELSPIEIAFYNDNVTRLTVLEAL